MTTLLMFKKGGNGKKYKYKSLKLELRGGKNGRKNNERNDVFIKRDKR
jgi:hypothetical protein